MRILLTVILSFLAVYIATGVMGELLTGHVDRGFKILISAIVVLYIIYVFLEA